ncbi:helix-turn-helix transcriptional regulator [Nitrosospira sp. NRS527]|uniref:helix-turn-helix transcriptional regulator n=1 Tax=Nitrosospira sp. NRS527 TaxID=155925 RepID=UPI001AF28EE3|nr:helix-turn-helix transcriptional regulator [Nitrosospira sp. NRS527]BCT69486.1 hypothetical protein NNRS527_03110 [Nitrosospira sp. NRS527]
MKLGSAIEFARKSANLTTKQLAKRAGVSQDDMSSIEVDKQKPSLKEAEAIAEALDIPLWALMRLAEGKTDQTQDIRRKLVKARMVVTHQPETASASQELHCLSAK